ncbi:TIGR03668 family PPOX class F420-dependent oxidoreductase [Prauserella muralis]|uniref:PPOX class F420-dependent oxidoreductase n=1 Tax=Prauserella muralis TaxID=588067 RepID=A0A2V4APL2_9PSEU|nr:TIGR03668 family PPOX class F420-dependent oxidoreductase [Prauserella muralis]PXY22517.1 PPOX class F420-dependent oxidoreductase [Prauserella muralis]TWE28199.1 PPOX class probable F420-dependent enzyme [Prauserella muralis]
MRLPQQQARHRFSAARVARLATCGDDRVPHLVPVTFAMPDDHRIVFAVDAKPKTSTNLRRLRNIAANPHVSLLVDHYAEDWTALWWVRADGVATVLTGDADRGRPLAALAAKYPQYSGTPPQGPLVSIAVTTWRGWSAG